MRLGYIKLVFDGVEKFVGIDTEWGGGHDDEGLFSDATVGDMRAEDNHPDERFPASPVRTMQTRSSTRGGGTVEFPDDDSYSFRARDGDSYSWPQP